MHNFETKQLFQEHRNRGTQISKELEEKNMYIPQENEETKAWDLWKNWEL